VIKIVDFDKDTSAKIDCLTILDKYEHFNSMKAKMFSKF